MNLKGKHRSKFFILIAGIIIFAHAVVPHHHHFDSVEAHPGNLECENTRHDKHNENPDTHCHAFNLIISDSGSDLTIHSSPVSNFNLDLFWINANIELVSKHNVANNAHCFLFFPHKQIFLTNHSLRAPPATV